LSAPCRIVSSCATCSRSHRAATHTQLDLGGRRFEARVLGAAVTDDDLAFRIDFAPRRRGWRR